MRWGRHKFTTEIKVEYRIKGAVDEHGNEIVSYESPVTVTGAVIAPSASTETDTVDRDHIEATARLFLPYDTRLGEYDRVTTTDGQIWLVEGIPAVWGPNPFTGSMGGLVAVLERGAG